MVPSSGLSHKSNKQNEKLFGTSIKTLFLNVQIAWLLTSDSILERRNQFSCDRLDHPVNKRKYVAKKKEITILTKLYTY